MTETAIVTPAAPTAPTSRWAWLTADYRILPTTGPVARGWRRLAGPAERTSILAHVRYYGAGQLVLLPITITVVLILHAAGY
jgi:hypothetical protein